MPSTRGPVARDGASVRCDQDAIGPVRENSRRGPPGEVTCRSLACQTLFKRPLK